MKQTISPSSLVKEVSKARIIFTARSSSFAFFRSLSKIVYCCALFPLGEELLFGLRDRFRLRRVDAVCSDKLAPFKLSATGEKVGARNGEEPTQLAPSRRHTCNVRSKCSILAKALTAGRLHHEGGLHGLASRPPLPGVPGKPRPRPYLQSAAGDG
jgi:hypothetical protein